MLAYFLFNKKKTCIIFKNEIIIAKIKQAVFQTMHNWQRTLKTVSYQVAATNYMHESETAFFIEFLFE